VFLGTALQPQATHGRPVSLADVRFSGSGLNRPECVLCTARGDIFSADWRGGVAHIRPDGTQAFYGGEAPGGRAMRPNGVALRRDGSFLLADLGEEAGGLFHLTREGRVTPLLEAVDGVALPPSNFVLEDALGRIWLTVSTRLKPRSLGYRAGVADGFIVLLDGGGARIVADGLGYTNEVALDASGQWLYVNETFSRRLSRFRIGAGASLGAKEVVTEFGAGTFPDGLTMDAEGGVWITSIVSNRVIRVAPDGAQTVLLEDADADHLKWVEAAYQAGELGRPHLDNVKSVKLRNISSLAFGGPDLRTAYLGCLLGDTIASFRSPVAGLPPAHWHY